MSNPTVTFSRIVFQYSGGEMKLVEYKRPPTLQTMLTKAENHANDMFGYEQWEWSIDPDVPVIEGYNGSNILILPDKKEECVL